MQRKSELKRSSSSSLSRGKGKRRAQPKRFWGHAREKVEEEGGCRFYRSDLGCAGKIEAAHVVGREHDEPFDRAVGEWVGIKGSFDLYVDPVSIVPLCKVHHDRYDGRAPHPIDLLPVLSLDEQVQAVRDAGGIALALRRISGRDYGERAA